MNTIIKYHHELDSVFFTEDADFGQHAIVRNVFLIAGKTVQCITTYAIQDGGDLCSSFRLNISAVCELFVASGVGHSEAQDAATDIVERNAHYVASYTLPHIYGN